MSGSAQLLTSFVIEIGERPSVSVDGSDGRFPVGRIYCIGRNYADHAKEMGHDPDREPPFFFMKPADSLVASGSLLDFPVGTSNFHHEIELVVALGTGGTDILVGEALDHVWGYGVGLDMTRRDRQTEAKKLGQPWEMGKSFDESAPISNLRPVSEVGHPESGAITLAVNGTRRQEGDLAMQIWKVPEQIVYLSRLVALRPGDLIFTGTPAGVGPVEPGDHLEGRVQGIGDVVVSYRRARR